MINLSKRSNFTSVTGHYYLTQSLKISEPNSLLIGLVHMRLLMSMTMVQSNLKPQMMKPVNLWSMATALSCTINLSIGQNLYNNFHSKRKYKCWINTSVFFLHLLLSCFDTVANKTKINIKNIKKKYKREKKRGSLAVKTSLLAQYKLEFSLENQACLAIENSQK